MEKTYFMIVEGKQVGPLVAQELKYHGLTPETFVWHEGLPDWVKAGSLPELASLFAATQQPYSQQQPPYPQQQPPYSQPQSNPYRQQPYSQQPDSYVQQQPYSQSGYRAYGQPQGYGRQDNNGYNYGEPIPHTNWLPWAIVTTICGVFSSCIVLILGIIAIVKANKANQFYNMGNAKLGAAANSTAKTLVIVGLILVGLGILGIITLWNNPVFKEAMQQAMLLN